MTSPLVHVKRAFGWNLGRVTPSARESAALGAAGVTDPVVQQYAVWRRSLLLVALVPTLLVALFSLYDAWEDGFDELTYLGAALELAWLLASAALPVACWIGLRSWTRPGAAARTLGLAWLVAFLLKFAFAFLPMEAVYHVEESPVDATAELAGEPGDDADDINEAEKVAALQDLVLEVVKALGVFFLLLPAVLSILPGAMNGCLRIKSLLPAAQLPGWLLVWVAPIFLLFWLAILVLIYPGTQSPLLVLGVLLWAGGPLAYARHRSVFVESQLGAQDVARIGRAKRAAALVSLAGIALIVAFLATSEVVELSLLGTDPDLAMNAKLEEFGDDDALGFMDIMEAYAESDSLIYVLDTKFASLLLDILAKLLVVTAIFAHLVFRATLAAWRNGRVLLARTESADYDARATAAAAALDPAGGRLPGA